MEAAPSPRPLPSPAPARVDHGRRNLLLGMGWLAAAAAMPWPARAASPAAHLPSGINLRPIPRTGEQLPVLGLGTFLAFDRLPGAPRQALQEVFSIYWDAGARLVDTSPLYGTAEVSVGDIAARLGVSDALFVANKIWSTGDYLADDSHARRSLALSCERLWRERIDLMQCHSLVNVEVLVPILQAWKQEGLVRYFGITHYENPYHALLAQWIERARPDFVQVNYSIANPAAEREVLPAALANGTAVLCNMPFEKGRLFTLVRDRPLPPFARELGITGWAEFFLKWVASHPAVTCVLAATANPAHARENVRALRGPLPDAGMRERMRAYVAALPGFAEVLRQPWYPGRRYEGLVSRAQRALRERLQP
ncbi:aldo/keto reductase [Pseudoxanthomonas taiwanensis]|jgi:Aldo/keto reductases, related to diketogulonate reductase|uniref:Aldo/keto reductase n=2 Tax=Pseudoxanthomonas taiwanensis TaxID=176598 RepID=A0A921NUP7_9GAMM|nr:aldo/keto reductase [Pseudoxanthomonas taiwanensis]